MVVADTGVLIDAIEKAREPMHSRVRAFLREGELATTAISLYELTAGPRTTPAQLELLHAALAPVVVLPLTRGAADVAAGAARHLARAGASLAVPDTLIAGICIAHDLPLLTRNRDPFSRIPGLRLVA